MHFRIVTRQPQLEDSVKVSSKSYQVQTRLHSCNRFCQVKLGNLSTSGHKTESLFFQSAMKYLKTKHDRAR